MVFSKGDLRKKKCCTLYMGRGKKRREKERKILGFRSPSKGLVLFWETVDGGVEHF